MTRLPAAGLALVLLAIVTPGAAGSPARAPAVADPPVLSGIVTPRDAVAGPGTGPVAGAPLPAPPGRTTVIPESRKGGFANAGSLEPSMSADGRFVAFTSVASDLVANDDKGTIDVFVLDRQSGRITRAPLPPGDERSTQTSSTEPAISADGRWVAFTYQSPPVGTTGALGPKYIVVWDRRTGVATYAASNGDGQVRPGHDPSISGNGRYVAFTTPTDMPGDKDGAQDDVARWDRRTGDVVLVTPGFQDRPIAGFANQPSISGDGNLVAFVSDGGDTVIPANTGAGAQVFVRNIRAATTEQVSLGDREQPPRAASVDPAISGDGRYVAFASAATNLTDEEGPGLFRRDLAADATIMVSVTPQGAAGNGGAAAPSITTDGSIVAWTSTATNLVPETLGRIAPAAVRLASEVFVRDIAAGETLLVSVSLSNGPSLGQSFQPSVGGGGRFIAFASNSAGLVKSDDNSAFDAFLRDLPPVPVITPASLDLGSRAVGTASLPLAATLGNGGWTPLKVTRATITGNQKADFRVAADGCAGRVLRRNESCTVSVVFAPKGAGTRTAVLAVADDYAGSPRTVRLRGGASKATLVLDPPLGQPGIVTIAEGSGFPPGIPVRLSWSRGITPRLNAVVPDARGRFRVQVLVFHNDLTGARELVAEPQDGTAFPSVAASMLVTKPAVIPPRFEILRLIDLPLVLVIRG